MTQHRKIRGGTMRRPFKKARHGTSIDSHRAPRKSVPDRVADGPTTVRLQRVLAGAGLGSRRSCEQLILDGRVEVDGQFIIQMGTRVDPNRQVIRVDGVVLRPPRKQYFLVNKPPGVVSTKRDPARRTRVVDLIPQGDQFFTVGRLDRSSEGLILVTNDGELAHRLTHPRFGVRRVYRVEIAGAPSPDGLAQLRQGLHLAEGRVAATSVRVVKQHKKSTTLELVLTEGINREIRRMAARIGHKVLRLRRIAIGPIKLGELPRGAHRELPPAEVTRLKRFAFADQIPRAASGPKKAISRKTKRSAVVGKR
jgi:23S rRNA pseudouridine2605 synthase